jgi:CRP/FNR family transcriptional regulator, cyclic AMP receptor protein
MPCDPQMLDGVELFEHLTVHDRNSLADVIDLRSLPTGQILFRAGEPGDSLFVVQTGEIELYIKDTAGQKIVLTVAGRGEIFGELSLLDQGARTATAVALIDSQLLELDRGDLLLLFEKAPEAALRLLASMGHMTRKADALLRTRVSRNANQEFAQEERGLILRIADWISWFSGSMSFLLIHTIWFILWIVVNMGPFGLKPFDPYPYGLLTMIVSLEAIFLSCIVLISQNRQAEKDRIRSDIEYDVNVKAELEIAHLHEKTDRIHEDMHQYLVRIEKMLAADRGTPT